MQLGYLQADGSGYGRQGVASAYQDACLAVQEAWSALPRSLACSLAGVHSLPDRLEMFSETRRSLPRFVFLLELPRSDGRCLPEGSLASFAEAIVSLGCPVFRGICLKGLTTTDGCQLLFSRAMSFSSRGSLMQNDCTLSVARSFRI